MRCHLWKWSMISYLLFTITSKSVFPKCKQFQAIGRVGKPKWGTGTGTRTRTRQMNEWFKLGSMIDINTPPPFFLHASQDGWWYTEPFWKKRYEYKEHSNHSFRLNDVLIIQKIFACVCRSRQRAGAYGKLGNVLTGINRAQGETTTESATTWEETIDRTHLCAVL